MEQKDFILASASPQRISLLRQIGMEPKEILPADIDESEKKFENITAYVKRMALEKARAVAKLRPNENVLAGDVSLALGGKIIHKAKDADEQRKIIENFSGRSHHVICAICLIDKNGKERVRCVDSRLTIKRLSKQEIDELIASNQWQGCCGYKIEGIFGAYVKKIIGSYSAIVGMPLFETKNLLNGVGIR